MRVLGIDPGIARCGWGIVEERGNKLKTLNYGCFETESIEKKEIRLKEIHSEILRLIKKHSPDVLAIEELFFNTNVKTAFMVGEARGVILLAAAEKNIPVFVFTPLQVKMAVTGYGRAEKTQVGKMIKLILRLSVLPKLDDTTDALAVAITCLFSKNKVKSA